MGAQNVLVSMGASGALLIGEDGREYVCAAAQGEPINTFGAGDSRAVGSAGAFSETLAEAAGVSALLAELNEEKRDPWGSPADLFVSICAASACLAMSGGYALVCR